MKNELSYIALGGGIALIAIGLIRIFLWNVQVKDAFKLFILAESVFAIAAFENSGAVLITSYMKKIYNLLKPIRRSI